MRLLNTTFAKMQTEIRYILGKQLFPMATGPFKLVYKLEQLNFPNIN